jgi:outer membrane protein TolC
MPASIVRSGCAAVVAICCLVLSSGSCADTLSLASAENLALHRDPAVQAVEARSMALTEQAVAAGQLPDPRLKFGLTALPTDTFQLGQEPMTQVQLGLVQHFPRGRSRSLRTAQLEHRASGMDELAAERRLQARLAVREAYFEVFKQKKLAAINREAIAVFSDLANIIRDYYATGRAQQQDVLRAEVELSRIRDRATLIAQEEDRARARLAAWIGDSAFRDIHEGWPEIQQPAHEDEIRAGLVRHPRILALQKQVLAAETGIELAQQGYKPEFSVDLTYGGRGGLNADGSERADLLSMMVSMDVPLFAGKRQDRTVAARVAESSAATFDRDDAYRRMRSELEFNAANLRRERERLVLFESTLLPQAEFNADATFDAYQAAVADLTALMRARITEFELQLEYANLLAESLKTRARLLYLQGASS